MNKSEAVGRGSVADVKPEMKKLVFKIQKHLCEEIEKIECHKKFHRTEKKTDDGMEMVTVLESDNGIFEKVGVHASFRSSTLPVSAFSTISFIHVNLPIVDSLYLDNAQYFTADLSGVMYPKNPHIPTLYFSYKYFEIVYNDKKVWWFSGSTDLCPSILDVKDCQDFHQTLKSCCDKYDKTFYKDFKKNCDEYFYLKHRGENRGIGGIFFETLNTPDQSVCFKFVSECMDNILSSYMPIVLKNKDKLFNSKDGAFQLLLRARYVEFLLTCNKATEIALLSPGVFAETILIFLPPTVSFKYDYSPKENSKESYLLSILKCPIEWV